MLRRSFVLVALTAGCAQANLTGAANPAPTKKQQADAVQKTPSSVDLNHVFVPVGGNQAIDMFGHCATSQQTTIATCVNGQVHGNKVGTTMIITDHGNPVTVTVYQKGQIVFVPVGGTQPLGNGSDAAGSGGPAVGAGGASGGTCTSADQAIATCVNGVIDGKAVGTTTVTDGASSVQVVVFDPGHPLPGEPGAEGDLASSSVPGSGADQAGVPGGLQTGEGALGTTGGLDLTDCVTPTTKSVFLDDRGGGHSYLALLTPGPMVDATHRQFIAKDVLQTDPGTFHPHHRLYDVTFLVDVGHKVPPSEAQAAQAAAPGMATQAQQAAQQRQDQAAQDKANQIFLTDDATPGAGAMALADADTTAGFCPGTLSTTTETSDLGGCFTSDNLVLMADGSQKPIAELRIGDLVRDAVTGRPARVARVTADLAKDEPVVTLGFGSHLTHVTVTHPILTAQGLKAAGDVRTGDYVYDEHHAPQRVDTVTRETPKGAFKIYNVLFSGEKRRLEPHYLVVNGVSAGDLLLEGTLGKTAAVETEKKGMLASLLTMFSW